MNGKVKELVLMAMLAVLLTISGSIKLPSFIPGTEFQLSAPFAIALCVTFGFKRYFVVGLLSSALALTLQTHTIINVVISLIFRLVAGGIIHTTRASKIGILISGPIASTCSRLFLSVLFGKAATALILAAAPGMIFTMIMSYPTALLLKKIARLSLDKEFIYEYSV